MATDKRLRVSFDAADEVTRRALYIAAAMTRKGHGDVINELIQKHLAEYMELARKAIERDEPAPRQRKNRPAE